LYFYEVVSPPAVVVIPKILSVVVEVGQVKQESVLKLTTPAVETANLWKTGLILSTEVITS